jgi:tetratricopeptide (TPR) repeat protein
MKTRNSSFAYETAALKRRWPRLHQGDCEPCPRASAVQQAWRLYHAGDFLRAAEEGLALGPDGVNVANKALAIHATYVENQPARRLELFQQVAARGQEAATARPKAANAHYFRAMALGRYSQLISVARALTQGIAGQVKKGLEHALRLQPRHAEAHSALGLYHAEVVAKVGAFVGRLTHDATPEAALRHFARAVELNPDAPIAYLEYARGLELLYGRERAEQARELRERAARCKPMDAMEAFDVDRAHEELGALV